MSDHVKSALTPIAIALDMLRADLPRIDACVQVELLQAVGRVLATDFVSRLDVPPHDNSAMDGYAVRAMDLGPAETELRVSQRIAAGQMGTALAAGEAARIFTGAPLPPGADAVVMQENCTQQGEQVRILQPVVAGENLRRAGEDVKRGTSLLAAGHRLRPQDIGLLASTGATSLDVRRRPRVALMTTGDELVRPGSELQPGQIYNSNMYTLAALLQALQIEVIDLGVIADDLDTTRTALEQAAATADCVISTGGVSVGEEDHVKAAVESLGQLSLWKLAIKPGKPFAYGNIGQARFFGLPGNPVSAFVTFVLLVRPCLLQMLGCNKVLPQHFPVRSGFDALETGQRQEYLRVSLHSSKAGEQELRTFNNQSSGVGASLSGADGLAIIPPHTRISRGDSLDYIPFSELIS
jgi:molybdopterin molybdotransferase